jgi:ABC-type transport system involved in multi-copper enzyme maturation permease subunit
MKQLVSASCFKLRKSTALRVTVFVTMFLSAAGMSLFHGVLKIMTGDILELAGGDAEDLQAFANLNFLDCGTIALSVMQLPIIIMAVMITINISEEYKNGAMIIAVSRGYSRQQIYISKLYETLIIALIICMAYLVPAMVVGGLLWHGPFEEGVWTDFLKMIITVILMYMTTAVIFMNVAIIVKNGGGAAALNLLIAIGVSALITTVDTSFHGETAVIRKWWIFTAIEQSADLDILLKDIIISLIDVIVYSGLAIWAGTANFFKREF